MSDSIIIRWLVTARSSINDHVTTARSTSSENSDSRIFSLILGVIRFPQIGEIPPAYHPGNKYKARPCREIRLITVRGNGINLADARSRGESEIFASAANIPGAANILVPRRALRGKFFQDFARARARERERERERRKTLARAPGLRR
jgi:hypothetical protein